LLPAHGVLRAADDLRHVLRREAARPGGEGDRDRVRRRGGHREGLRGGGLRGRGLRGERLRGGRRRGGRGRRLGPGLRGGREAAENEEEKERQVPGGERTFHRDRRVTYGRTPGASSTATRTGRAGPPSGGYAPYAVDGRYPTHCSW